MAGNPSGRTSENPSRHAMVWKIIEIWYNIFCMIRMIIKSAFTSLIVAVFLFLGINAVQAFDSRDYEVRIFNGFDIISSFPAFEEGYNGGASIAAGDLGDDGIPEIIIGSGQGKPPEVKVFRQDGSHVFTFYAYAPTYGQGINVAICDLDGDNQNEIVTGTQFGGGPHVRVFDANGNEISNGGWFAYNKAFRGGVNVACGDWDGDGFDEVITGAGPSGGPHVRIFDGKGNLESQFFAFDADQRSGVSVSIGKLDDGEREDVIVAQYSSGDPIVRVYKSADGYWFKASEWLAYMEGYQGGVSVSAGDIDYDGLDEVVTAVNGGGGPHIRFFDDKGNVEDEFFAFEQDYRGGARVAMADINGGADDIFVIPSRKLVSGPIGVEKFIDIDITSQRLTAYEWGIPVKTFPVSSGTWKYPTPIGKTQVWKKVPLMDYVWSYGAGHPDNYNLPGVEYNLKIFRNIFIHYAYWHNNFGHRMSHGCVNMRYDDVKWVYEWADVGTPAETHY